MGRGFKSLRRHHVPYDPVRYQRPSSSLPGTNAIAMRSSDQFPSFPGNGPPRCTGRGRRSTPLSSCVQAVTETSRHEPCGGEGKKVPPARRCVGKPAPGAWRNGVIRTGPNCDRRWRRVHFLANAHETGARAAVVDLAHLRSRPVVVALIEYWLAGLDPKPFVRHPPAAHPPVVTAREMCQKPRNLHPG